MNKGERGMSEARNPLAARAPRILAAHARAGESAQGAWAVLVCTVVIPVDLFSPFTLPEPNDHSPTRTDRPTGLWCTRWQLN